MRRSMGSISFRTKSWTQSSSFWNSSSVAKDQVTWAPLVSDPPAVYGEHGSGRVGRGVAGEVQGGADDLVGSTAALQRAVVHDVRFERLEIPRLADVGEERTRHDAVHPHLGAEGTAEARG